MKRTCVLVLVGSLSISAYADWSNRVVQNVPGTVPLFQGTENFQSPVTDGILDANVDFAVFAPGAFSGSFNPFPGYPGFNPADYTYVYQMYNNGPAHGGTATVDMSQIALGLSQNGLITSLGRDPAFDPSSFDVPATLAYDFGNSAVYLFVAPALDVDEFSEVLLLSSPYAPVNVPANVVDGGGTVMGTLPGPVPEPASGLLLLALFGVRAAYFRRRRA